MHCQSCACAGLFHFRTLCDFALVQHEISLLPRRKLWGLVPPDIGARRELDDHLILATTTFVTFINCDHSLAPMRVVFADGAGNNRLGCGGSQASSSWSPVARQAHHCDRS